jgi:hypothetical protein
MADDVTLDDLQKVYKRIDALEAGLKETNRLLKVAEDYTKDLTSNNADDIKAVRETVKKLEGRVGELEKKTKK